MPSRRAFLTATAASAGALIAPGMLTAAARQAARQPEPPIFSRYDELLELLDRRGHARRVLGYAPDGSPVVCVEGGGSKLPAIFVGAGAHSTEHAGVVAAVELLDHLETDHKLYIIPTRDPIGLNGFRYALSLSLGEEPPLTSVEEAETLLRQEGEILYDEEDTLLVLIGEIGYANRSLYRHVKPGSEFLEPLRGRRLYWPSHERDQPGAAPLQRAYTQVVTPDAEVLHLNRFHDTEWAPVEVRCTRKLMAEIQPGLTFDLHEFGGDAFWLSARHQRNETDELWEEKMARAAVEAVAAAGGPIAKEEYSPGSFFKRLAPGAFWLEAKQRGEGLNLIDFAAARYGPGFTIETGMRQPFAQRVQMHLQVVQTAVRLFEERHAAAQ